LEALEIRGIPGLFKLLVGDESRRYRLTRTINNLRDFHYAYSGIDFQVTIAENKRCGRTDEADEAFKVQSEE
jgi:hypothetical protein